MDRCFSRRRVPLSCLDEDCTGRVRYPEYLAAMTAEDGTSERLPAETIEDAFRRLNVDGADGLITQASSQGRCPDGTRPRFAL